MSVQFSLASGAGGVQYAVGTVVTRWDGVVVSPTHFTWRCFLNERGWVVDGTHEDDEDFGVVIRVHWKEKTRELTLTLF